MRIPLGLPVLLSVVACTGLPAQVTPERRVGHLVRSLGTPAMEIVVDGALAYLGPLRYTTESGARVEAFVFGDTAAGVLRRAFIAHFEGYPDGSPRTFAYPRLEMSRLGGHEYLHQTWAIAEFGLFDRPAARALLAERGLTAERRWLVDRYVRVVDSAARHEVIFFYLEAGALHDPGLRFGGAPVTPPPPPEPPEPLRTALRARAAATFEVRDR